MDPNLKPNEKELIKLIGFFKKRAEKLIREQKLDNKYEELILACEKLTAQLQVHALKRKEILEQRDKLKTLIKDNAECPKCNKSNQLKQVGVDTNEKGWKSNKYRCRNCNIEFVQTRPNNPWDMIPFLKQFMQELEAKFSNDNMDELTRNHSMAMLEQMRDSLDKLSPVIEASDEDYRELKERDLEMDKLIHEFKNNLLIERIKMDTWENRHRMN
jgi:hypothetical protein